jgi:nucleoside-diphosphate-sugar epimerase
MRQKVILITGANGEVGHGLIRQLYHMEDKPPIVVVDVRGLDETVRSMVDTPIVGDIRHVPDGHACQRVRDRRHFSPACAAPHTLRIQAGRRTASTCRNAINLLHLASSSRSGAVKRSGSSFPVRWQSTGCLTRRPKAAPPVKEDEYNMPITMYGCNKLYCEHLGRYYMANYRQLAAMPEPFGVDFRCVRFPGLISAQTTPSGGTSDYAPEMLHAAAQGKPYAAFVRPDTVMPFMAMPDGIKALLMLTDARAGRLSRRLQRDQLQPSAEQMRRLSRSFPHAQISWSRHADARTSWIAGHAELDDSAPTVTGAGGPISTPTALPRLPDPTVRDQYK